MRQDSTFCCIVCVTKMSPTSVRCINCELRLTRTRIRVSDETESLVNIIRLWTYPRQIMETDYICQACWGLANHASGQVRPERQLGHQNVCFGCGRSILRTNSRVILRPDCTDEERQIADIISQWVQHRQLTFADEACAPCWLRAIRILRRSNTQQQSSASESEDIPVSESSVAQHQDFCINCESQFRPNDITHRLSLESQHLVRVIKMWTYPRNVLDTDYVCHACWELANHEVLSELEDHQVQPVSVQENTERNIILPNIRRAADTRRHCLFLGCTNPERNHVADRVRRQVLADFNFYIPRDARICNYHMGRNLFHELYVSENSMSRFGRNHIEDMIFILAEPINVFDFENVQHMPEHIIHYFLGVSSQQHQQILNETQRLQEMHRGSFALTALLCKLRTGDSGDRLSSLFQTPRRTVETLMEKAREILVQDFVPQHLGLEHMSRDEVASKNSAIGNGIFGNSEIPIEDQKAIVMCDSTYVYTQKSANYLFQKESYSLHKYRNLIKPFMMVCGNGYILDVYGPYPATTNDATIMNDLLQQDSFVEFFQDDDVFILDRGFRDSIDAIYEHGFEAHMPEALSPGQSQLTTLQANRSRCVTINRWVVEAVNGRIKRDYKLFRQEYFNRACPHMMKDFSIAAALHNTFAIMFRDSDNAQAILAIIHERLFIENILAQIVQGERLSRRNSLFHSISRTNVTFPNLTMEELVLFACGTYQIRQARSYIGEQFRFHGLYTIQVSRDEQINLSSLGGISPFLIRAQMKSRHVSRKSYFVFIAVDRDQVGRAAILGYCCNCIVGLRTVGCCSHVMSIVWYLGYARHLANMTPPAQFLDEVLVRLE